MSSNVQIIWKSLRNALNFRSILFLCNGKLAWLKIQKLDILNSPYME